jgi:hypothetical protein
MEEPLRLAALADSQHYRELANKHRTIARQCQSPGARQRILDLASWYEGKANHLDTRGTATRSVRDLGEVRSRGSRSGR